MTALANLMAMNAATDTRLEKAQKTAREFEGVFIGQMMAHMFDSVKTDPMFGGGAGEDMFRSMLVQEIGNQISKAGGIGLSNEIQKMMIENQGAQS